MREHFLLDPNITFLNHGSFGACPRPVFEAYQRWQRELERQPVEFLGRRYDDLMAHSRTRLAEYLCTQPDHLVYLHNATAGVNTVARSLQLQAGDEILTHRSRNMAHVTTHGAFCVRRMARSTSGSIFRFRTTMKGR